MSNTHAHRISICRCSNRLFVYRLNTERESEQTSPPTGSEPQTRSYTRPKSLDIVDLRAKLNKIREERDAEAKDDDKNARGVN